MERRDKLPVKPLVDELEKTIKQKPEAPPKGAPAPNTKPGPAELDQDAGGGYNPDGTYPQT